MEARNSILTELTELGSSLASMPAAMPFEVPGAYFNSLATDILVRIQLEENLEVTDVVPTFGTLTSAFTVPEGYFESFSAHLAEAIQTADFEVNLPKENPFLVPAGYFDQLAEATVAAVAGHDEEPAFGKLAQPFEAPAGYFDGLPAALQSRIKTEESTAAPTIPIPQVVEMPVKTAIPRRKTIALPALRWAAAAALLLGIFTGIERAGLPQTTPQTTMRALASLPKDDLERYVSQNIDEFDAELMEVKVESKAFPETTPASHLNAAEIQSFFHEEGLL